MAKQDTGHRGATTLRAAGRPGGREVPRQRGPRDTEQVMDDRCDAPGPAKGETCGIATVTPALDGLRFPTCGEHVLGCAGDPEVDNRKAQLVSLRRIVEDAPAEALPSLARIVHAVSRALAQEGLSGERRA